MITNKIAHLFIVHILNSLDDTVISKKKILSDVLLTLEENKSDDSFVKLFMGIYAPNNKRYFGVDEIAAFTSMKEHTSSKKDDAQRRTELMQIVTGPLEKFFEENMLWYLMDTQKNPLLARTLSSRIELGQVRNSDAVDEMFR